MNAPPGHSHKPSVDPVHMYHYGRILGVLTSIFFPLQDQDAELQKAIFQSMQTANSSGSSFANHNSRTDLYSRLQIFKRQIEKFVLSRLPIVAL